MGFLDNLLKKETRKAISKIVGNAVDNVFDNINDTINSKMANNDASAANNTGSVAGNPSATNNPDEESCYYEESVVRARIEKVAAEEWPGYELRQNISSTEMGAEDGAMDYSYGLYLNGVPMAMILILDSGDYRLKKVRLAHQACRDKGVFCMNLMLQLPNRRSYISEMLRKNVAR